jgi:Response regulator containing CheY-like receiver domain and AraC-type DNA-binding domain
MYKLMIVDDEPIVLESITFIVNKYLNGVTVVDTAWSGREAIEKAEISRPDIVIMDIKMPGLSGLDAIAEIKSFYSGALFIVVSAYEHFEFAQEALKLGVIEYIAKPLSRAKIIAAIENAVRIKEEERRRRSLEIERKEKLAIVLPVLESGFIYSILFADDYLSELKTHKNLLEIQYDGGYIMTLEFAEENEDGKLVDKIGSSVRSQRFYPLVRDIIKENCDGIVGPMMFNRLVVYVPCADEGSEYDRRLAALHTATTLYEKLVDRDQANLCIGIGNYYADIGNAYKSYDESLKAIELHRTSGVVHINDIPTSHSAEEYPELEEKRLLKNILLGDTEACLRAYDHLFGWMRAQYHDNVQEILVNSVELLVMLRHIARENSISDNIVLGDSNYVSRFLAIEDIGKINAFFTNVIKRLAEGISASKEKNLSSIVVKAQAYIYKNFSRDITLEDVSKEVTVSPNYFSRLFKEETGRNFIDYLTELRIERAKELLRDSSSANKEICYQIGYSDPNYFSRIFKRVVGVTPTEYKLSGSVGITPTEYKLSGSA